MLEAKAAVAERKAAVRLAHVPLLDGADLLGEANLLVGEGIGHPRLADCHPAGVLPGAGEDRVQRVQRAPAVGGVGASPGFQQLQGRGVAGILGQDLTQQLQRPAEVLKPIAAQLGQAEGGLAALRALALLGAPQLEGEGQVLELAHRRVEPVQRGDGLAVQRVGLGDAAPGGGGALLVVQLPLQEEGHLPPQRDALRRVGHHAGQGVQGGDQPRPVLGGAQEPLQGAEGVAVLRLHRQHRLQLGDGPVAIVELLLLDVGQLAVERHLGRAEVVAAHQLLEHVGEPVHRVGVLGGAPGGGAEVGVAGGQAQRPGQRGEGQLRLTQVVEVDVGSLLEGQHPLQLVLRRLRHQVECRDQLPVLLHRLVGRNERTRSLGAHRLVLEEGLEGGERLGIVGLFVQDGGVRLDGIGTGPQTRGLPRECPRSVPNSLGSAALPIGWRRWGPVRRSAPSGTPPPGRTP